MSRAMTWSLPCALVAAIAGPDGVRAASACNFEGCPNLPESCYSYYWTDDHSDPVHWCQTASYRDCPNGICNTYYYTPVNYSNHSGMPNSIVDQSATNLGYPPNGPANSLLLVKQASSSAGHDIDVWNAAMPVGTWGQSSFDGGNPGGLCYRRGSNGVYFDMSHIPGDTNDRMWITQHELGHSIGLGHVCTSTVMNPCGSFPTLTSCDAQGIHSLYNQPVP